MPFPLGQMYNNAISGSSETFVGKMTTSHIATSIFIILIIAIVILLVFWPYIVSQKHWTRYLIVMIVITGIIMFIGGVATYMYRKEKREGARGGVDSMNKDMSKYENIYPDVEPSSGDTVPNIMKIAGQDSYTPSFQPTTYPAPPNNPPVQVQQQPMNFYRPPPIPNPQTVSIPSNMIASNGTNGGSIMNNQQMNNQYSNNQNMNQQTSNNQNGGYMDPQVPHCQAPAQNLQ